LWSAKADLTETIKILGVGQAPSRGVRKREIVDFETAMKCVHEAVVDAETKSDVIDSKRST
jgi:cell division protein FtsA